MSALVVAYITYLAFSAVNAQATLSIGFYKTAWFETPLEGNGKDNNGMVRCVYNEEMTLLPGDYPGHGYT